MLYRRIHMQVKSAELVGTDYKLVTSPLSPEKFLPARLQKFNYSTGARTYLTGDATSELFLYSHGYYPLFKMFDMQENICFDLLPAENYKNYQCAFKVSEAYYTAQSLAAEIAQGTLFVTAYYVILTPTVHSGLLDVQTNVLGYNEPVNVKEHQIILPNTAN